MSCTHCTSKDIVFEKSQGVNFLHINDIIAYFICTLTALVESDDNQP